MIMNRQKLATSLGSLQPLPGPLEAVAEPAALLEKVISVIIGFMTVCGGIYFIFIFITATYQWMNAGGDKASLQRAQQKMVNALIGLVMLIGAYAIISLAGVVFGFSLLNPASIIDRLWGQ